MINPKNETVNTILNSSKLLSVPEYQRAYEWGNYEVAEFWNDLISYKDSPNDDQFFLGTLIFNIKYKENEILIVDGQQRITTIFICLIACKERLKRIGDNDSLQISTLIQNLITSVDPTTAQNVGIRLNASKSIRDIFEIISESSWDGISFPEKLANRSIKTQVRKVEPIYKFFLGELTKYEKHEISAVLKALYSAYFVRIDIESDEEAFKIFERNNARGVDLEAADLLKNYLFQTIGPGISETWEKIIANSENSFPRMLKYFYISHKGYEKKSNLYRKLKTEFNSNEILNELRDFSEFYKAIKNCKERLITKYLEDKNLNNTNSILNDQEKLQKIIISLDGLSLFNVTQIYPLLYSAIECFNKTPIPVINNGNSKLLNQFILFFETLEKYHFINTAVCNRVGNEVEHLYAKYANLFFQSSDFIQLSKEFFEELKDRLAQEGEFVARFTELNYEQTGGIALIMYIFDRIYNFDLTRNQPVSTSTLSRHVIYNPSENYSRRSVNVDHWYPQNAPTNPLNQLTKEDIHNIGNLIILSFKANSSLNNDLPNLKIERLKNGLSGEIQNSNYVKNFINEYEPFCDNWNAAVIKNRAQKLANLSYSRIWKL